MQKVSLYIPCYNAEAFLPLCLEAVFVQTRQPEEVIVVDDGSTDSTVAVASHYPVKIVRHEKNRGLAAARNTGVKASSHSLVASLDSDCVPRPSWLEKLLDCMENDHLAGVGGMLVEKNCTKLPDRWRKWHMVQHWGNHRVLNPPFVFGNNNVFRKSAIEKVGWYNEKLRTNFEDVAMSADLIHKGFSLAYQPEAIVEHLRCDTFRTVLRTNWKWRFFGHAADITFRNAIAHFIYFWLRELYGFLKSDLQRRDVPSALLSLIAVGYAALADLRYVMLHWGEKKMHG